MTRPLVLSRRCASCIVGGPNPAVGPARAREVIRANLDRGTLLTCHSTLYGGAEREAACRGFFDAHGARVNVVRVMERLAAAMGLDRWYEEVDPPDH